MCGLLVKDFASWFLNCFWMPESYEDPRWLPSLFFDWNKSGNRIMNSDATKQHIVQAATGYS